MIAAWMLARPEHAEAAGGLLAGSPRIERERPETVHMGRVIARIGDVSKVATRRLDLSRKRVPGGYYFRFSKASLRAMRAQAGGSVSVSVRVAQMVDLDSDGHSDDRAVTSTTQSVPLARPALSIELRDGDYENGAGDSLTVSGGYVVSFFFFSGTSSPCGVGPSNNVQAPIDPQTGEFSFTSTNPQTSPPADTTAMGTFTDNADMTLDASIAFGSCTYDVSPTAFSFLL